MPSRVGSLFLLLIVLVAMLVAATTGSAWHEKGDEEYDDSRYVGGDPRIPEDARRCMEQTVERHEDVGCTVKYIHISHERGMSDLMTLDHPPECAEDLYAHFPSTAAPSITPGSHERIVEHTTRRVYYDGERDGEPCTPASHSRYLDMPGDVALSRDADITAYWYLSSKPDPDYDVSAGLMPCLSVHMALQSGEQTVASGTTTKTLITTPPGSGIPSTGLDDPCPGATGTIGPERITEFEVDLGPARADLDGGSDFQLYVHWYQWDGEASDQTHSFVQNQWRLHSSDEHANRVVLPVENSLNLSELGLQYFDDKIYIRASFESPWGHDDLDGGNARVQVFDSNGDEVPVKYIEDYYMYSNHDPFAPRNITFPWDYQKEDLESGIYTIRVTGANWQHTAEATNEATLHLEFGGPQAVKSPMPSPLVIPVVLVFGVMMLRRKA